MSSAPPHPRTDGVPARRDAVVEHPHGYAVTDPYRWLEDGRSPECAAWLEAQERMFAEAAASWPHRAAWRELLEEAAAVTVDSPPVWRRGRRFRLRTTPGRQLPALAVTEPGGPSRTLLDPLAEDASGAVTLDAWRPSPGGNLLAYQMSHQGDERPRLRVLDVASGRVVDGPLETGRVTPVAWLGDTAFCYVSASGNGGRRLRLHRIGTDPGHDPVLFTTDLPQLSVTADPSGRRLAVSEAPGATSGNRLWLADLRDGPAEEPRFLPVFDGTDRSTRALLKFAPGGRIHAVTDDGAPFGRLCAVDPAAPHSRDWETVIAEEPGSVLYSCAALTDPDGGGLRLLVARTRRGLSTLRLHAADGSPLAEVATPGPGHVSRLTAPPEGAPSAWFTYTDFTTPPQVHRFDLRGRRCVPDPEEPARTPDRPAAGKRPRVEQVTYTSDDGTPVRMHLVTPPGRTGPLPTLLTAYGGFGASTPPTYSPSVAAWVAAGGAYAIASVRGGGEEGTGWHAAGRGAGKPNAVTDLLAAARWLIGQGRTGPDRLAIRGSSHSGFMVAAALTREPGLFAAAVCSDPVTDMLRYHLFGLGRLWTEEFGTAEDPDQCAVLLGYSPYHRVRAGTPYPAVLLTCPRVDPRVDSLHARKMTAALQHATTSGRPVVLRCESGVGHGPRSLDRGLGLQTDVLAFCAAHTGLTPGDASR
ncbi:prolyl oligopeptidase family serine peptidase [Nocardiopsis algeriensis]|uniref:prolyl oligopeptidase n=1 Tax=Nocardiopsis algeriensis TaxID=1478215 RepID=A0A841IPF1_9ACTN|nr:prolyl oligopeptidase family serine peptidase [Nocardiopsis algeriensis]MBB6120607.1 prolyl oligopeptidase [Nocardiopsis algeriensis]